LIKVTWLFRVTRKGGGTCPGTAENQIAVPMTGLKVVKGWRTEGDASFLRTQEEALELTSLPSAFLLEASAWRDEGDS